MQNETQLQLRPYDTSLGVEDLLKLDGHARTILEKIRDHILSPEPRKVPPLFSSVSLSALCEINKARFTYLLSKGDLPTGQSQSQGRSRQFTLAEVQEWVRKTAKRFVRRPAGTPAVVIVVANFKGGSTKTTTCMATAQGLSLRGYKVLVLDLDPQASLTNLCGLLPEKDVRIEDTIMPYITGRAVSKDETAAEAAQLDKEWNAYYGDLKSVIRKTYWEGLDIIPATNALYGAEYQIPANFIASNKKGELYRFWELIQKPGLAPVMNDYDVILFDTPPALSYLTLNALMAADGILMPLPPKSLDFASSTQFWSLFSDLASSFRSYGVDKRYDFVNVLLSNVESNADTPIVREWIQAAYDKMVLPVEIPTTSVAGKSAIQFGTVYDVSRWDGNSRTYTRARQAYDNYIELLCQKIGTRWANMANSATAAEGVNHEG